VRIVVNKSARSTVTHKKYEEEKFRAPANQIHSDIFGVV
jgi:hypothetical protein